MATTERILRPVKKIRGGLKLPHLKNTAELQTVVMPPPEKVYIPLSQHIGAPATATVKKGDNVFVGTKIGEAAGAVSAPIHSSVSGIVADVTERAFNGRPVMCVIIDSDGKSTLEPTLKPFEVKTPKDLAEAAKQCGLVGLGGAGFPSHIKLSPKKNTIDTLIVNGAECEPFITSDYRECMENYNDIIEGIYLIKEKLDVKNVAICVENNKPQAIKKLFEIASDRRDVDDAVKLIRLPSSYPQGAEKVLIYSATGRQLPVGKLPSDIGCIVMNITSIGALYRFITTGVPLISKRITLDGTAIKKPMNISASIGTPIEDVLKFADYTIEGDEKIIMGGPMMGNPVSNIGAVIEKRTNAILVMAPEAPKPTTSCIRCGRCAGACPMRLFPARVESALNSGRTDNFESLNVNYCMECGSCSYICPASRPLTQIMRIAKAEVRRKSK